MSFSGKVLLISAEWCQTKLCMHYNRVALWLKSPGAKPTCLLVTSVNHWKDLEHYEIKHDKVDPHLLGSCLNDLVCLPSFEIQTELKWCQILLSVQHVEGIILLLFFVGLIDHQPAVHKRSMNDTEEALDLSTCTCSFVFSWQEAGEGAARLLAVRRQAEVPNRRVVLRSQVPQTQWQDPRLWDHPGVHEAGESSWFRCVRSLLPIKGLFLMPPFFSI